MSHNATSSDISSRISILRFIMIFGIVVLHTPEYVPIEQVGPGLFNFIKAFFQSAAFRCTVPVLTFISGYLLFSSGLDTRPKQLLSKKFQSLVIPFLVFNLPLVAVAFLLQLNGPFAISYQLVPYQWHSFSNAAFATTAMPINYPLYFLRDLFVLCLLAPAFGWLLRRAALPGLVLVALIFLLNLDQSLIIRRSMPVSFYLGGLFAVRKLDLRSLDKYAGLCFALFLLICGPIIWFKVENTTYLRLVAPLLIWPSASLLVGTRFGAWAARMSKYSFFIFLAHAPVLMVSWKLYSKYGGALPYPLYWFGTPVLATVLLIAAHRLFAKYLPGPFAWARGVSAPTMNGLNPGGAAHR
jgi:succinoglycan biosynthesis protein ExoH